MERAIQIEHYDFVDSSENLVELRTSYSEASFSCGYSLVSFAGNGSRHRFGLTKSASSSPTGLADVGCLSPGAVDHGPSPGLKGGETLSYQVLPER